MCGSTPRISRTVLIRLSSWARCHLSSSSASKPPGGGPPALFTSTSTPPRRCSVSCSSRLRSAASDTSAAQYSTCPPVASAISDAVLASCSSPRLEIITRAPSAASWAAVARPRPLLAAVTSATRPVSSRSIRSLHRVREVAEAGDRAAGGVTGPDVRGAGGAGRDDVTRQQGHDPRVEGHQPPRPEGHVRDDVAAVHLAVVDRRDLEGVDVVHLVDGPQLRTEAAERIEALRAGEVARVLLEDVLGGHVHDRGEAGDHGGGVGLVDVLALLADDHAELALGGRPLRLRRDPDRVAGADDRGVGLEEAGRLGRGRLLREVR